MPRTVRVFFQQIFRYGNIAMAGQPLGNTNDKPARVDRKIQDGVAHGIAGVKINSAKRVNDYRLVLAGEQVVETRGKRTPIQWIHRSLRRVVLWY